MANPDLQIREGGGHPDHEIRGGGGAVSDRIPGEKASASREAQEALSSPLQVASKRTAGI